MNNALDEIMRNKNPSFDSAVSPVVGVLLMLVVTIIIAAVVSSFAGGLANGQEAAPSLSADIRITNTGNYVETCGFMMNIVGTDKPIPTKNLKMTTAWTARDGTKGGVTIEPWDGNWSHCNYQYGSGSTISARHGPTASGSGVNSSATAGSATVDGITYKYSSSTETFFGNYTLQAGTTMKMSAMSTYGVESTGTRYEYGSASNYVYGSILANGVITADGMQAMLGQEWNHLRPGDQVTVTIYHIPSGKLILKKVVTVED
jgi:archaeal type IV pilus assembly protein PilA